MAKLIAILNVIAWSGFWAFGYLALTSGAGGGHHVTVAFVLAALGAAIGIVAWLWLVRHSEATGYAKRANQVPREHHRDYGGET
ncbi:hypothetical protein DEA8626_03224 [Defluviimonas aquaemixtae]|uniref:Uncharacterized protein n=1 Tax=Albidovulum aquaemixtae TaxID=1542388 RepID=A0A2R8BLA1_9RHOB|nr:hypothetical protein [Defluviimonas aquaemixtae]SPH24175.1 hypothetical protein DEA8626_03224 [Defluviimonas aquaemixtae]